MADYATLNLPQGMGTSIKGASGLKLEKDEAGNIRGRSLYSAPVYILTVPHDLITDAQKASLEAFYVSYGEDLNSFTYDGDSTVFNVLFTGVPAFTWVAPDVWNAKVVFTGHKV